MGNKNKTIVIGLAVAVLLALIGGFFVMRGGDGEQAANESGAVAESVTDSEDPEVTQALASISLSNAEQYSGLNTSTVLEFINGPNNHEWLESKSTSQNLEVNELLTGDAERIVSLKHLDVEELLTINGMLEDQVRQVKELEQQNSDVTFEYVTLSEDDNSDQFYINRYVQDKYTLVGYYLASAKILEDMKNGRMSKYPQPTDDWVEEPELDLKKENQLFTITENRDLQSDYYKDFSTFLVGENAIMYIGLSSAVTFGPIMLDQESPTIEAKEGALDVDHDNLTWWYAMLHGNALSDRRIPALRETLVQIIYSRSMLQEDIETVINLPLDR